MDFEKLRRLEGVAAERVRRAEELAAEYGLDPGTGTPIIGRVSRSIPARVEEGENIVVAELDPLLIFSEKEVLLSVLSINTYLGIVDVKTGEIVVARLVGAERLDATYGAYPSSFEVPRVELEEPEPGALISTPRVHLRPILIYDPGTGENKQASYIVDPQSPVFIPNPERLPSLLGLPTGRDVAVVGALTVGDSPIILRSGGRPLGARVGIPFHALLKHVFVVGTTGAGKTTFLKNMVYSLTSSVEVSGSRPVVMVLDANRDYLAAPFPPRWRFRDDLLGERERMLAEAVYGSGEPGSGYSPVIMVPLSKDVGGLEAWARSYVEEYIGEIAEAMGYGLEVAGIRLKTRPNGSVDHIDVEARVLGLDEPRLFRLVPFALEYRGDPRRVLSIDPYITEQARELLPTIVKALREVLEDSSVFVKWFTDRYRRKSQEVFERRLTSALTSIDVSSLEGLKASLDNSDVQLYLRDVTGIHPSTLDNIRRRVVSLAGSGIFDVRLPSSAGRLTVGEPDLPRIVELADQLDRLAIVDLSYAYRTAEEKGEAEPDTIVNMLAYFVLSKLLGYVEQRARRMVLVVDEAHSFFPAERGQRVSEYAARVAGLITRLARLGRSRGLGIVFATHSIRDVNDRVLLLTNTKVVFRVDEAMAAALDLPPEYRRVVPMMGDRVGVVKSYYLRGGIVSFRTPMPFLGHRDISAA